MRKFIKTISIVLIVVLLLLIGVMKIAFYQIRSHLDFRIQHEKHILVIGSSLSGFSINDSILVDWRNISKDGTFYLSFVPVLDNVLAINPQVDTVFIAVGIPSFSIFDDHMFYNAGIQRFRNWRNSIAISDSMELKYYSSNPNFIPFLLTSGFHSFFPVPVLGNFVEVHRHTLLHGEHGIDQYKLSMVKRGGRNYSYEMLNKSSRVQMVGLEKMIAICKKHHVQCVILNTPVYHIERFYEDKGYVEYLSTLDDSLLIADYTSFIFPDTLYYGDVHHLNHLGAEYFCKYIKKNGVKTQYLIDYVQQKKGKKEINLVREMN